MYDPVQIRYFVREVLEELEESMGIPYSEEAENLLLMTAAHESKLGTYLVQTRGPAQGFYQIEPDTYWDLRNNWLRYRPEISDVASSHFVNPDDPYELSWNLKAATVVARLQYRRVPEPLPRTLEGKAKYAKEHWNTHLGKATEEDYLNAYKEAFKDGI